MKKPFDKEFIVKIDLRSNVTKAPRKARKALQVF